jgi:general secretion pathway protein G
MIGFSRKGLFAPPRRRRRRRGEEGFTLVEMLVVITIIGMIMALVGPRVLNYLS